MTRGKKLLLLLLVLALAIGAYFLVRAAVTSSEEKRAEEAAAADTDALGVGDSDAVSALSWTYLDKTVTLVSDDDGIWYCPEEPSCPVDQSIVSDMRYAASAVVGEKVIEQAEDLSEYGLDEPELLVTVTAGDVSRQYAVGDYNAAVGAYYMTVDGGNDVYLTDSTLEDAFWYDLENLVDMQSAPDAQTLLSLTVTTLRQETTLLHTDDPLSVSYSDSYEWFLLRDGSYTPVDTDGAESLCNILTDIEWQRCVTWDADEAVQSEYGLDEPQAVAELCYLNADGQEQRYTLDFGAYADADTVYVLQEDSGILYTCYGTVLDTLKAPDADAMLPEQPFDFGTNTVKSLALSIDGESRTVDAESAASFLASLANLRADGAADAAGEEELIALAITFDGGAVGALAMRVCAYDSLHCTVERGGQYILVSRTAAEALVQEAKDLLP